MCNDTLELLRIKDENIKYINQEIRKYTKAKHIVSQFGFDLKHKKDALALEKVKNKVDESIKTRSEAISS
ncbi:hypothetical protein APW94_13460, partial [Staphylococcus aureus]